MVGAIRRAFRYLNCESFVPLYKSLVKSHLESNVCAWNPYKLKDISQIESLQKRATKLIPELKGLSYQQRLERLRLPTMEFRRCRGDMIEMYKIINEVYDNEVTIGIPMRSDYVNGRINRGHSKQIFHRGAHLELRKNSFTFRCTPLWNSLTEDVVSAPNVNTFKNRLDRHWRNQPMLYRDDVHYIEGAQHQGMIFPCTEA